MDYHIATQRFFKTKRTLHKSDDTWNHLLSFSHLSVPLWWLENILVENVLKKISGSIDLLVKWSLREIL